MAEGKGLREVAWLDYAGGGQVVLDGDRAYIGHMDAPHGTSVVDVSDPKHPRITASVDIPAGLHSHKVRVANDIMLANRERTRGDMPNGDFVGLRVFDVSNPDKPQWPPSILSHYDVVREQSSCRFYYSQLPVRI